MSSKRHQRRKACEGKIQHVMSADAHHERVRLQRRHGGIYNVYPCDECGFYHVGHRRNVRNQEPHKRNDVG